MLRINKLKTIIRTSNGNYGFNESFDSGLNFIASEDNTCGKSSILAAIYYCLGMEEIIGGKGEKVLTSVYKTSIEDGEKVWPVLESAVYLEVYNGNEVITIYRTAKMHNRDSRLITVYFSSIDSINDVDTIREDMYVHMPNSAVNKKGFHTFLEKYIGVELPIVSASDDSERKLYLQLIFSCMFIEQKRGWADIFSGMPILGIKDAKKRVLEFMLGLDTISNEHKKNKLANMEAQIKNKWERLIQDIYVNSNREECIVAGLPTLPQILDEDIKHNIKVIMTHEGNFTLDEWIDKLQYEHDSLKTNKPKVIDNFDELQVELQETEKSIKFIEEIINNEYSKELKEDACIKTLFDNLEIIKMDLLNNKDASRLKALGAEAKCLTSEGICPVCNQSIEDTLLPNSNSYEVMSIEENINHLEAQKLMFEFALKSHESNKKNIGKKINEFEKKLFKLRRLAKAIRSDLYSVNDDISETVIRKRVELSNKIESLNDFKSELLSKIDEFMVLSQEWKKYLNEKALMPTNKFSKSDIEKIELLEKNFICNLEKYGYKSVSNLNEVKISRETYLPITEGFDMKFDSSASDNIRAIWAFTMALLQTSIQLGGNHPGILIFDEPDQHSIVISDMEQFFKSIIAYNSSCQVLIGITIKDSDTKSAIAKLKSGTYKIINIGLKAFKKV